VELDFPALVRLLLDVIPNPWQGARILKETLAELAQTQDQRERIIANRSVSSESNARRPERAGHKATELEFRRMLSANELFSARIIQRP
jgi:type III restriction enzyme